MEPNHGKEYKGYGELQLISIISVLSHPLVYLFTLKSSKRLMKGHKRMKVPERIMKVTKRMKGPQRLKL